MQALNQFSIPIKGLKFGIHEYDFKILKSFFDAFPNSLTKDGNLDTHLTLDKKTDHLDLVFTTKGTLASECDRCTANIDLPIESTINFIVKFSDEEKTDGELFFIPIESHEINVAEMIYEHLLLSMPLIKVYDCENENPIPCNQKVLDILNHDKKPEKVVKNNVFGDALKNLKITKTK
ncbi:MAG: DUF177 domain-containing protein [Bacteroidia bacterium]|nr:DUF177 domain-containing protein [Bacteroidia bacterium]